MKKIIHLSLGTLLLSLTFCSGDESSLRGISQSFTINSANDNLTLDASDPSVQDDVAISRDFEGTTPVAPAFVAPSNSNDDDGDGLLDGQDNIPTICTKMVVTANGVSSARIELNSDELYSPSDFHNSDFTDETVVNLRNGGNSLAIRLNGSPGDQLNVRIYNCSENPAELIYQTTVTRITGSPEND